MAAYIGERLSVSAHIPLVTTAHARFSISPIKKYMSRWGYYVIAVSEDIADELRSSYRISAQRIRPIPNGIDTERFSPQGRRSGSRVLFVSRLDPDSSRAAYSLCRIAGRLLDKYRDIEIDIIGGGEEYSALCALGAAVNRSLGREVLRFLGSRTDVERYMAESDIFVGVSRAALEAMSCGLPTVLAGKEGFLGELGREELPLAERSNFCGRGLPTIDDEKLFLSVSSLLDMSPSERAERGRILRSYVIEMHSARKMSCQTLGVYEEALSEVSFGACGACICGYYGFGNLGDDTLLDMAIKRARERYGKDVVALTRSPRRDRYRFGVRCISRNNIFGIIYALRRSGRLILGGGTLLQDRTSLRSLFYYASIIALARFCGAETELWGNGIGPVRSRCGRRLCARALSRCSYIGLRDRHSEGIALSLGAPRDRLCRESDLAFGVGTGNITAEEVLKKYRISNSEKFAVFAVAGKGSRAELDAVRQRAESFARGGGAPVFVCMYPKQDMRISKQMSAETAGRYIEGISAEELIALLSRASFACGMRLHLLIFAKIAGVEFEGIGSDPKIKAFCDQTRECE